MENKIIKAINYLVFGTIILVPLVYFKLSMYPFQAFKIISFQILAEIIFALWLALVILNKSYRPKFTPLLISLCVFMAVISLSAVFGEDWRMSLWSDESRMLGLVALWHFFGLSLVLSSLKEKINWKLLWKVSFWTAVAVSFGGIMQKFGEFQTPFKGFLREFLINKSQGSERIGSTFGNPAFMSGYLIINFFVGLRFVRDFIADNFKKAIKDLKFWGYAAGVLLIILAVLFSQTLATILGISVGVLILLIYPLFLKSFSGIYRNASLLILIIAVLFAGILFSTRKADFWQNIPGLKRIVNVSFEQSSIRDRLLTWQIAIKAFEQRPILGWGFENFRNAFDRNYDPVLLDKSLTGTYWDKPHNVVLEYAVNTGILGLLAYLGLLIVSIWKIFKKFSSEKSFFLAAILAYFIQNLFVFDTIGTYLMFFLMLAFIDSYGNQTDYAHQKIADKLTLNQKIVFGFLSAALLVPVYYNYQTFNSNLDEYWGVNYFLNHLPESSLVSFTKAMNIPTPYISDVRQNFANTVKQASQQGIMYPSIKELQGKITAELEKNIEEHPNYYFDYIVLAEFKNNFYRYNPNYLSDAKILAQKALELSPKRQQVFYLMAKTSLIEGDIKSAYDDFKKAISLNEKSGDPHFYFGLMAYGLGDAKTGSFEISEAKRLGRGPQTIEDTINLGNFVGDLEHNYKKSIEYYKEALSLIRGDIYNNFSARQQEVILKLSVAYYFDNDFNNSRIMFNELKKLIDLKTLSIYPDLRPILQELGIEK